MNTQLFQEITKRTQENCNTKRAENLLKLLQKIQLQFEKAPASSSKSKYDAEEGGLMKHILKVHDDMGKLADPYASKFPHTLSKEKLWTVALLHDLHKTCDAAGTPYYEDNILLSGKISKDKPFKTNKTYLNHKEVGVLDPTIPLYLQQIYAITTYMRQLPSGACSLALIQVLEPDLFQELQEDERQAILWHEGGYGDAKYAANGKEGILTILTHTADMLASLAHNFVLNTDVTDLPAQAP